MPSSRSSAATASRRSALRPVTTTLAPAMREIPCDPTSDPARRAGDDDHPSAHVVLDHAAEDNAEVLMPGSGDRSRGVDWTARSRSIGGAARGIGAAVTRRFAEEGATLWLGDVLGDELASARRRVARRRRRRSTASSATRRTVRSSTVGSRARSSATGASTCSTTTSGSRARASSPTSPTRTGASCRP